MEQFFKARGYTLVTNENKEMYSHIQVDLTGIHDIFIKNPKKKPLRDPNIQSDLPNPIMDLLDQSIFVHLLVNDNKPILFLLTGYNNARHPSLGKAEIEAILNFCCKKAHTILVIHDVSAQAKTLVEQMWSFSKDDFGPFIGEILTFKELLIAKLNSCYTSTYQVLNEEDIKQLESDRCGSRINLFLPMDPSDSMRKYFGFQKGQAIYCKDNHNYRMVM